MNVLYTSTAHATGDGRNGHARSEDGILDIDMRIPKEMGGAGGAANPEMLFAAGYAACFHSALKVVGRQEKLNVDGTEVIASVGIGTLDNGGFGLTVDLIPPHYIGESLTQALLPEAPDKSFLLVRAAEARDILPETLTAAGATVTIAEAYRNQNPTESIPALQQLFNSPSHYPDAITFTSASTARNLSNLLEAANLTLPPNIVLASIGPITSETLRDIGHPPTIEAAESTIPALVASLEAHFKT